LQDRRANEAEQRTHNYRERDVERNLRLGGHRRLRRRIQYRDVRPVRTAFDLGHHETLHGRIVGPLRAFHVPAQHADLVAVILEFEYTLPLLRHGAAQLCLVLPRLPRGIRQPGDDFAGFTAQLVAQALVLRTLALKRRVIGTEVSRKVSHLRLGQRELGLQPLDVAVCQHLGDLVGGIPRGE
jgi:hypothetical protein